MRGIRPFLLAVALPIFLTLGSVRLLGQEQDWDEIRSIAESQHEIIMLMIKNQEFESVPAEAEKICALNFPAERYHLLAEGTGEITDALIHNGQFEVGHEVLDSCARHVVAPGLLAELFQLKAYLFKKTDQDDLAMEYFKKAIELKKQALEQSK